MQVQGGSMLSIQREDLEAREHQILSPEAAFSDQS